jgi:polysaccharide export outer membrane protein
MGGWRRKIARFLRRPGVRFCLAAALAVSGQAGATNRARVPVVPYAMAPLADYRIGPLDKLNVTVFEVKDLTIEKIQVDAGGQILLPLIGAVSAQGKTTTELSAEIARRLGERYLRSPQVSVVVAEAVSQKVSVEGAVNKAGVFELKGRTGLLEAVARAEGTSRTANRRRVTIIRNEEGQPRAATFDLAAIQRGLAPNPELLGNDVVVVDDSRIKTFWRGFVEALPALIFVTYL